MCPLRLNTIEYDPNRSARIALLFYADGEKTLHSCTKRIASGSSNYFREQKLPPKLVMHYFCKTYHSEPVVHNIELRPRTRSFNGSVCRYFCTTYFERRQSMLLSNYLPVKFAKYLVLAKQQSEVLETQTTHWKDQEKQVALVGLDVVLA